MTTPRHTCTVCKRRRHEKLMYFFVPAATGRKQWKCKSCFDSRLLGKHCKADCLRFPKHSVTPSIRALSIVLESASLREQAKSILFASFDGTKKDDS